MILYNRYSELVTYYERFYGRIAADQNQTIIDLLSGKTLLDVFCGYGQFVVQVSSQFRAVEAD